MNNKEDEAITVGGETLKDWLSKRCQKTRPDVAEDYESSRHVTRYRKPRARYKKGREQASTVRHLTRNEIIKEYGLDAGNMTRTEQILWAVKHHCGKRPNEALTLYQMIEASGLELNKRSHSAAMAAVWKKLGVREAGAGYIGRVKVNNNTYAYYKATDDIDQMSADELFASVKRRRVKEKPESTEFISEEEDRSGFSFPSLEDLNVNLNFNFNVLLRVEFSRV